MANVQKSLRIDAKLYERIRSLKKPGETESALINRIISAGCDALLGEGSSAGEIEVAIMKERNEVLQARYDELLAHHEEDKRALAEKDAQLSKALERTFELVEQSHVLVRMVTQGGEKSVNELPAAVEVATEAAADEVSQPKKRKKKRKKKK